MSSADAFAAGRVIVRRNRSRVVEAAMAGQRACAAIAAGDVQKSEADLAIMVMLIREEIVAQGMTPAVLAVSERGREGGTGALLGEVRNGG